MSWMSVAQTITPQQQDELLERAAQELQGLSLDVLRDRQRLSAQALNAIQNAGTRIGVVIPHTLTISLAQQLAARVGGLGVFDELLPPNRNDLSEIVMNPDGGVWVLRKGEQFFESYSRTPSIDETWRSVEALLAPIGRSISEAQPSVDAKLPRMEGMGGARVKIIHPVLTPGKGYPSINIRLFEPRPVPPEQIIAWGACPESVMRILLDLVRRKYRLMVIGGTATGKTTFLSAMAHGIPSTARIVKIEDPEEIWLPQPNVVTLEARPQVVGSDVPGYSLSNGVDDAMRMAPNWLIVGEVRTGQAALSLFRAQMSDHPGLSTLHAESPQTAIHRLGVLMFADAQVRIEAAKEMFVMAVDLLVQVGWRDGRRQVLGVWEIEKELKGGNVAFRQLYQYGADTIELPVLQRE
ncbi:MAG: Type II/IV secretion system ATP hydrolase TadA/VirB11/CpaF, TadA subfamily [Anaerolineae bacterium]|nr:MAG: Type II/IV secretion system ATP hydrolase TadA/VirB11/CpaF, TadA subfamily [Anaerolineae bacterium]